jgi:hypothetical protein
MTRGRRGVLLAFAVGIAVTAAVVMIRNADDRATPGETPVEARESSDKADSSKGKKDKPLGKDERVVSAEQRAEMLVRAQVWREPATPVSRASFADEDRETDVRCKFKVSQLGGTTPKFDCELESGEEIRIKYGKGPEIPAETASTRLLRALGFGADHVRLVERLRCYGCPEEPFSTMKAVEVTRAEPVYEKIVDYADFEDFEWAAIEEKFAARPIETERQEGWAFFELKTIDPNKGGAPRAHVDALRLLAVFLAHWDNKPENQRLVCLTNAWKEGTPCPQPFLLIQDTGATWGPGKVDLDSWSKARIWEDRATCQVSMRDFPYDGATFEAVQITEGGRQMLGRLLAQLTDAQLTELFTDARFHLRRGIFTTNRPVAEWVGAFKARRQHITEGSPCPQP